MLQVENLSFSYGKRRVFREVSFEVGAKTLCGLFGPNGAGKTTLFKCCLNLLKAESGTVAYDGRNANDISVSAMARVVSYVPQEHSPPFPFLVREIVLMGLSPHFGGVFGLSRDHYLKAEAAMERVGIAELADEPYTRLSGGQRQLTLIARALAQDAPLILLDEPTAALDFRNQIAVWRLLREIADGGKAVLACAHDPNHVSWFCDEVVVLADGVIVEKGKTRTVFNQETLAKIYADTCKVGSIDGFNVVYPRHIAVD
jgi:iron complex transport system ATP-binding protein